MNPDGPKWGREEFFPTNPDLADILSRTDFDFENLYFWDFFGSQLGPSLGVAWARAWTQLGFVAVLEANSKGPNRLNSRNMRKKIRFLIL